jgi:O-acetylserine/cysteine efflux transporter
MATAPGPGSAAGVGFSGKTDAMSLIDVLAATAVAVIWGVNISLIKISVAEFPPIFLTGLRFLIVAVLLIWWVRPPWRQMRMIGLLSFTFGGIHFGSIFYGLQGVDVSIVAIFSMLGVPCSVVFARLLLKERFGWKKSCGMGIAFAGVVILLGEPAATASPLHLAVLSMAVVAWGLGNNLVKMLGPVNIFALNAWMGLFASGQLFLASWLLENGQMSALHNASAQAWLGLAYVVLMATITGYGLWYYLVAKYAIGRVVPFTLLVPVVGVLTGVLMMGEDLSLSKVVGGVVTLTGVAIIQLRWRRSSQAAVLPTGPAT